MQIESTRFGTIEIRDDAVLDLPGRADRPTGGSGTRFVAQSDDSPFYWLHSVEDADVAVPVTSPWLFFADYEVRVPDDEARAARAPATRATRTSSASSAPPSSSTTSRSTCAAR